MSRTGGRGIVFAADRQFGECEVALIVEPDRRVEGCRDLERVIYRWNGRIGAG